VTSGDVRAFEQAERAARALLNAVVEVKRCASQDTFLFNTAVDRAYTRLWRLSRDLRDLPMPTDQAKVAGTISPTRGGGDHHGPDGNAA